ncbi:MAG: DUF1802 family protein [Phycisphaera sp.]|nr:DUF1802 family protein [Phycisphaera sp.]
MITRTPRRVTTQNVCHWRLARQCWFNEESDWRASRQWHTPRRNDMVTDMLHMALKEWSIVCDLLSEGRLALLLRKGGIHEDEGAGVFRLEHPRFALFPSWAHQKPTAIKAEHRDRVVVLSEPAEIPLTAIGEAARIWEVPSRERFETLDDLHCWTAEHLDMRFNYKPDRPLYLMAVRCATLNEPRVIPNTWEYGGCKSWVPLATEHGVDDTRVTPALSDAAFAAIAARVDAAFA